MKWCRITVIDLLYANIQDDGVKRLAAVLGQCASLAHLNLKCVEKYSLRVDFLTCPNGA